MGTGERESLRGGRSGDEARRISLQTLGRLAWAKVQKHRTCGRSGEAGKEAGEAGSNLTAEGLAYWTLELRRYPVVMTVEQSLSNGGHL